MSDEINSPAHYMLFPDMEAIDVIEAVLSAEEFAGYCKGNALKYRLRAGEKGPAEKCIAKACWYQDRLLGHYDSLGFSAAVDSQATAGTASGKLDLRDRFDEARVDQVARSHGDGEHYGEIGQ